MAHPTWCDYCTDGRWTAAAIVDTDAYEPRQIKRACEKHIPRLRRDRAGTPFSVVVYHPLTAMRAAGIDTVPKPVEADADAWCDACGGGPCIRE